MEAQTTAENFTKGLPQKWLILSCFAHFSVAVIYGVMCAVSVPTVHAGRVIQQILKPVSQESGGPVCT